MILVNDAIWDFATILVLIGATFYAWILYAKFKGGPLGRPNMYALLGILILLMSFLVRLLLDLQGIDAVDAYGVSVKDLAIIVSVFFFGAGARGLARFWTISKNGFAGAGKQT